MSTEISSLQRMYSVREVAEIFGVSKNTVFNKIRGGELRSVLHWHKRMIPSDEITRVFDAAELDKRSVRPPSRFQTKKSQTVKPNPEVDDAAPPCNGKIEKLNREPIHPAALGSAAHKDKSHAAHKAKPSPRVNGNRA
jgi:DNA-binding transcriptional MocR family regulator